MSYRRRKRLQNLTVKQSVTAPRRARPLLPASLEVVRVRNPVPDNSRVRHPATRRITLEQRQRRVDKHLALDLENMRRLHIQQELRRGTVPTYQQLDYKVRILPDMSQEVTLPLDHPICKERRARKQVLFAKNKAGRGAGRQRPPKDPGIVVKCK